LKARVLAVQASIAVAFFAFLLFTSNPFIRLPNPPLNGNDLNPLLQDPGLAFHPPFLYLGYVGLSMAFELGWGGWWFWDPVENASFMPWLFAAALLHSAIVVEKRETLKAWTVLLAILAFSFSLMCLHPSHSGVFRWRRFDPLRFEGQCDGREGRVFGREP